jgi:amidase/aspartyl-tRNA(Asn)/glutamyl-tRNA(Gln) amidotransferase subunit A
MAVDDDVQCCIRNAVDMLHDAGAKIEEVELGWTAELPNVWDDYWKVFMAAYFGHHLAGWRDRMDPNVVGLIEAGMAISAVEYKRLEIVRTEAWRKLASILARYDALLCPVTTTAALKVGASYLDFSGLDDEGRYHGVDMTAVFNLVGQCPALSVPAGFNKSGLPIGLQIVGQRFDDYGTLCIGAAAQKVLGFSDRRPEI